jgi:hypothetical protein
MSDKAVKPLGTFSKLMSSSPINVGQEQNSEKPENLKSGNHEIMETRKPENLKSGKPEIRKAIKYSTQLHENIIIRLKQFALVNGLKDYVVIEDAIREYLDKRQTGKPENLKT